MVLERTIRRDGSKEGFLRNFVSLINDYGGSIPQVPVLQVFRIFADWDNYPAPEGKFARECGRGLVVGLTKLVGGLAGLVGYGGCIKNIRRGTCLRNGIRTMWVCLAKLLALDIKGMDGNKVCTLYDFTSFTLGKE